MIESSLIDDIAACAMHAEQTITLTSAHALELCQIVHELTHALTTYAINGATVNVAIEIAKAGVVESISKRNALEEVLVVALDNFTNPQDASIGLGCSMPVAEMLLRVRDCISCDVVGRARDGQLSITNGLLQ